MYWFQLLVISSKHMLAWNYLRQCNWNFCDILSIFFFLPKGGLAPAFILKPESFDYSFRNFLQCQNEKQLYNKLYASPDHWLIECKVWRVEHERLAGANLVQQLFFPLELIIHCAIIYWHEFYAKLFTTNANASRELNYASQAIITLSIVCRTCYVSDRHFSTQRSSLVKASGEIISRESVEWFRKLH